jgi:hypothetical protein
VNTVPSLSDSRIATTARPGVSMSGGDLPSGGGFAAFAEAGSVDADPAVIANFERAVQAPRASLSDRLSEYRDGISIERVRTVLRLTQGEEAFMRLRTLGTAFAQAWLDGKPDSTRLLEPAGMEPAVRYGLMRLALEALQEEGRSGARSALTHNLYELYETHRSEVDDAYIVNALRWTDGDDTERKRKLQHVYFDLIQTAPTTRSVFDAVSRMGSPEELEAALSSAQQGWQQGMRERMTGLDRDRLTELGGFLALCKVMHLVQALLTGAKDLVRFAAPERAEDSTQTLQCARSFVDIASSALPASALDKLATSLLGTRLGGLRSTFFSRLHQLAQRWPEAIWSTAEVRAAVVKQLQTKQGGRSGTAALLAAWQPAGPPRALPPVTRKSQGGGP